MKTKFIYYIEIKKRGKMKEYIDNEQVKNIIKELMQEKNYSYRDLSEKMGTSQQNIHKLLNKNQLKLDDVKNFCDALGYKFKFEICSKDVYSVFDENNEEFIKIVNEFIKIAKEINYEKLLNK